MFHTQGFGHSVKLLELYDAAVCTLLLYLLAILYVNVAWAILLVVFNCETIAWWWTLAAKTLHLGANCVYA